MAAKKTKILDQSGQSVFEFVIYLPFLLLFFNLYASISGSINASINQIKVTRGYFFHIAKGDPNLPKKNDIMDASSGIKSQSLTIASFFAIGWREKESGTNSFLTCYKIRPFAAGQISEKCDVSSPDQNKTFLVRIGSAFGVCGATYEAAGGTYAMTVGAKGSCYME